jgi:hypothetical protein
MVLYCGKKEGRDIEKERKKRFGAVALSAPNLVLFSARKVQTDFVSELSCRRMKD